MAGSGGRSVQANLLSVLIEHGKQFTGNVETCTNFILQIAENNPVDNTLAADLISTIISYNLPEFNSEGYDEAFWLHPNDKVLSAQLCPLTLMESLTKINPQIKLEEVIKRFTQTSNFLVRDKAGVHFVSKCVKFLTPNQFFPVSEILTSWTTNELGQLSWIGQLLMNPDIICFGDFSYKKLNTSCLKVPPDESKIEVRNWLSLELLNVLLEQVDKQEKMVINIIAKKHDIFAGGETRVVTPALEYPDLLILGCIQLAKPLNNFRILLLKQLIVQLLINGTNSVSVLNALWNTDAFGSVSRAQQIVVEGLVWFYRHGNDDSTKLTKILEVAHELKPNGLAELFNVTQFDFAIDLACLAARRDFLKLDKFLEDKLTEHSEVFANNLVQYIKQRYIPGQPGCISAETFQTMFNALQLRATFSTTIDAEFNRLTAHLRNIKASESQLMGPRTPLHFYGTQAPTPNPFLFSRNGNASPGHLITNGSMQTPVFGNSQRPLGSSTPTYFSGSMDIRNPITDAIYRNNIQGPPPGWNSSPSGWSSRTTPVPNNPNTTDFRPAFAQPGTSTQSHGMHEDQQTFTDDIQDEANSYFQSMFTQENPLPVSDFIKKMVELRNSNNQRDKDLLCCIIKSLFEESKFFKEYPEHELQKTAEIYGGFINHSIVQNMQFARAVRIVIDTIHSQPDSKVFKFGIVALDACKSVLYKYPKVCLMLQDNPSFDNFPQSLKDYIIAGIEGRPPQSELLLIPQNNAKTIDASQKDRTGPAMMMVSNVDILEKGTEQDGKLIVLKDEALADEVSFMCNNLSLSNLSAKVDELKKILEYHDDLFRQWLAQYLVMRRITIEQNFHSLYGSFLLSVGDKKLNEFVKQETLRNIKILLKSDKKQGASNFGDRQLLKNLGHWLGLITIARNQTIVLDDLNMRDLLLEAFYKGQQELLFVIPFVVKVVIASRNSLVFKPTCAWINQILQILAEIHRQSDLKLNLKFEIEVLFKELNVSFDHIPSDSSLLQDTERITHMTQQLSEVKLLTRPEAQGGDGSSNAQDLSGRASAVQSSMYPLQAQSADVEMVQNSMANVYHQQQTQTTTQPSASMAHFHYLDVNINENIESMIIVPTNHRLLHLIPTLGQQLRLAVATAVRENINGIIERSVSIALSLTSDIVLKDFQHINNELQLRRAYSQMMRSMTAAIAMITTRESLATTILQYSRQVLTGHTINFAGSPETARVIDEILVYLMENNLEITSCFIVKNACEKAALEIDKHMSEQLTRRKNGLEEQPSLPPEVQAIIDRMPPELRPKDRLLNESEIAVYDYFINQMCGFKPAVVEDLFVDFVKPRSEFTTVPIADTEGFSKSIATFVKTIFDQFVHSCVLPNTELHSCCLEIRNGIIELLQRITPERTCRLIDKLVENFLISYLGRSDSRHQLATNLETLMMTWHDTYNQLMRKIQEFTSRWDFIRVVTRVLVASVKEHRFLNPDAYDYFIKNRMANCAVLDQLLARYVESEDHLIVPFVQNLCKLIRVNEMRRPIASYLPATVQQMKVILSRGNVKENTLPYGNNINISNTNNTVFDNRLTNLMTSGTASAQTPGYQVENRISEQPQTDDFFGVREPQGPQNDIQWKAECILREWMTVYYADISRGSQLQSVLFGIIQNQGIPLSEESVVKLFKTCLEIVLNIAYRLLKESNTPNTRQKCAHYLDPFCKLFCTIVKGGDIVNGSSKVNLLHKILDAFNNALIYDHDYRSSDFNGFPFYRIFHLMVGDLCNNTPQLRECKWTILEAFGHAMFYIQPRRAPAFAYHWLDIVGHRTFISHLLADPNAPALTRAIYTQLLVALLKFLAPSLRNVAMSDAVQDLYKGTLRVMLVVLHDFPELLCEFYFILCDVIPPNCIQLRNLVLSAYPRNMRLPDPFGQTFKQIEMLPEMEIMPKIAYEMFSLIPDEMRSQLDNYLSTRNGVTFLSDLANNLESSTQPGLKYNVPVLNAIVSYVGVCAISQLKKMQQQISISTITHSAYMDVFQSLAISFCSEGRYLLFNALANQLRYPSAQTHYFACTLLYLFSESKDDHIKEQITRVLFERLVSMRPHPWGLLITFIELIRNETYNFWKYEFVHCAPEIERLFFSVAQSCNVNLPTKYGSSDVSTGSLLG